MLFVRRNALKTNEITSNALMMLWQEPFQYLKCYAEITNNIHAGWFLSWFSALCMPYEEMELSNDDICHDLCFSKAQWSKVRSLLVKVGILNHRTEKKQSFYSLNEDKVELLLRQRKFTQESPSMELVLPDVVNVNRLHLMALTEQGVSLNAVILLSWLINSIPTKPIHERELISEPILIHYDNIALDTFLTKRQISNALKELDKIGITQTIKNHDDKEKYSTINFEILGNITLIYTQNKGNNNLTADNITTIGVYDE